MDMLQVNLNKLLKIILIPQGGMTYVDAEYF